MPYPESKTVPWRHQVECWERAKDLPAFYVAHEMGCISGDAKIKYDRVKITRTTTLSEFYEIFNRTKRFHPEIPIFVKSLCDGILKLNRVVAVIKKGIKKTVTISLESGKSIRLTPDHELLPENKSWTQAWYFSVGDSIATDGVFLPKFEKIISIEESDETAVYDFVMQDPYRNFSVNGIIVHNCGKSKVAVDYCNGIGAKKVLIICPKKVIGVWQTQFACHSKTLYRVLAQENGSVTKHAEEIKRFISMFEKFSPIAVVLNYERFWRSPIGSSHNQMNRALGMGTLANTNWDLLIADECHHLKSIGGSASWGMTRLARRIPRRLFLSGTPMPRSPLDIYSQFRALAPDIFGKKFTAFRNRYCVMGGFENRQVIQYKNLDELHEKFYSIAHRVTIEEAVDLPEYNDIEIECDLSPKAKKIYMQLEREFIAECENGEITADNSLTKLLRLAQITGGHMKLDNGTNEFIDSSKIDIAAEIIEGLPIDEPVVVFARFRSEIARLKEIVTGLGRKPGEITGSINDLKRWDAGEIDTVLVQIQAGGEGIDLTRARYCIYLSKGFSLGQVMQSRARVHRPGQNRKVTYYNINARGTVDVRIDRAIKSKQRITDSVLNAILGEHHVGHGQTDEICEAL